MKFAYLGVVAALMGPAAFAAPGAASLTGTHELRMGPPDTGIRLVLDCQSETNCVLTSVVPAGGSPVQDIQRLTSVSPVTNLAYAANALKYVVAHRAETARSPDMAESLRQLQPVLAGTPSIAKCWDLNYPEPEYMLVCTLSEVPASAPDLFLFATVMSGCTDVFCRYLITPMPRTR